ncbi:AMP-binding protein [Vibrio parahaemolyticus]|uniref:AMP-binding protein n=1 Tax=Vibrio parahaemolyticus TaxID=670 RepID=UPI00041DEBCE|nr:AMP-binding protein [Vibrio parahaemolyticus]EGQ8010515.1 long-chain fatty acid--CoA ligase [Vibrio parahaemolyticus]EHH1045178.1 long-chain fatty acid--CoA ligase [Vibrio parahaemolyticus]EHK2869171.1 AMP-binding protein [Vibrio parahaemolyticus]EHZ2492718.1 AMP-binding protein [Vibrio parahaemolyticus]EIA1618061.1 AMP-binding protein [Vibrio parahaemolyticus]
MNILLDAIEKWAKIAPDRVAFVGYKANQTVELTYFELLNKIELVAAELIAQNIKALALRAENSLDWAIVDLAAMVAGIIVVPIPTFFSDAQVEHTLEQSGVNVLVGDWQAWLAAHPKQSITLQGQPLSIANLPLLRRNQLGDEDTQVAYLPETGKITFTSGSTGRPKGVCLSNDHLCLVAKSLADAVSDTAHSHLVLLPLSTLLENITGVYVPLMLGVTSYILPGEQTGLLGSSRFEPRLFAEALESIRPESLVLTPALLLALIQITKQQPSLVDSLKFVAVGGAKVSSQLINAAHALNIPAFEGYGLSECGSVVCLNTPAEFKAGTCGKPLPHTQIRIAEDDELLVKGNVALGYLNEPFTQEWLATGDLAQIDAQGFVTLSGRKKNLIVTAYGRNVSPEWIESEALAFLPMTPLIVTGDSQQTLCAVIANSEDVEAKVHALNRTLPDYAQIRTLLLLDNPRAISGWYTDNGKLKRNQIEHDVAQLLACTTPELTLQAQKIQRIDLPFQQHITSFQTAS